MKKPRLPHWKNYNPNGKYVTGDAQEWTYEYTWEDYESIHNIPTGSGLHPSWAIAREIVAYFAANPEGLLEGGRFKDLGYTAQQISEVLNERPIQGRFCPPLAMPV